MSKLYLKYNMLSWQKPCILDGPVHLPYVEIVDFPWSAGMEILAGWLEAFEYDLVEYLNLHHVPIKDNELFNAKNLWSWSLRHVKWSAHSSRNPHVLSSIPCSALYTRSQPSPASLLFFCERYYSFNGSTGAMLAIRLFHTHIQM